MEPKRGGFETSSAGTGLGEPGQQRLSSWEMQRTTVFDGCSLVDGSSDLVETFFLEDFVTGIKPGNQTFPLASSLNLVQLQMSYQFEDKVTMGNEENKQFGLGR